MDQQEGAHRQKYGARAYPAPHFVTFIVLHGKVTTSKTTRVHCTSPPTQIVLRSMSADMPGTLSQPTIEVNTARRAGKTITAQEEDREESMTMTTTAQKKTKKRTATRWSTSSARPVQLVLPPPPFTLQLSPTLHWLFGGGTWGASVEARSPTVKPQRGSGRTSQAAEGEHVGAERAPTRRFSFIAFSDASIFSCSFLLSFSCSSFFFSS